ncbi:MAG: lysophospholipid acyltransferase family protein [Planctomycetota bacterium]|jgi:1-acyl-sn-glycerol-3-phosphate acyltransferase
MVFFNFRIYGLENVPKKGPFIIASNHQSYLDPLLCGVVIKRRLLFLARDTLFKNRFFGWLLSSVNAIPLRRGQADLATIRTVINILQDGDAVCLFPEGSRTYDGKIASLKPGFGLLCRRSNAALVPTVIDGAFECWPRDKKFFSRGSINVYYGKVIKPEKLKQMDNKQIAAEITDLLRQMQTNIRGKLGKDTYLY